MSLPDPLAAQRVPAAMPSAPAAQRVADACPLQESPEHRPTQADATPPGAVFGAPDAPVTPALRIPEPNSVLPTPSAARLPSSPSPPGHSYGTRSRTSTRAGVASAAIRTPARRTATETKYRRYNRPRAATCHNVSALPPAPLNLDSLGNPLKFKAAMLGPDTLEWAQADIAEFERLFATATWAPIHRVNIPVARRRDVTYWEKRDAATCREKRDAVTGRKTFRVRGTVGGDRINYTGVTAASTAALDVIKMHIHSVVSR